MSDDLENTMREGRRRLQRTGREWLRFLDEEQRRRRSLKRQRAAWWFLILLASGLAAGAYGELTGVSEDVTPVGAIITGLMVGAVTAFFLAQFWKYPQ